jgi:protease I
MTAQADNDRHTARYGNEQARPGHGGETHQVAGYGRPRLTTQQGVVVGANELSGLRVAFLSSNEGVEQAELTAPWRAVSDAGGTPELIAPEAGEVQAFNHLDKGDAFPVDRTLRDADHGDYYALVIPGGVANSDFLRTVPAAVSFVRRHFAAGKPAAVICHGPWVLVEADLIRDRTLTSW